MADSLPKTLRPKSEPHSLSEVSTDEISEIAQTAAFELESVVSIAAVDVRSRYKVLERLGAGGFGVVFKAWDAELERAVAIKLLQPGAGSAASLLAEARTLARLDPPAIVPVYDLGRTPSDDLLVVSKFIDGDDLGKYL